MRILTLIAARTRLVRSSRGRVDSSLRLLGRHIRGLVMVPLVPVHLAAPLGLVALAAVAAPLAVAATSR